jgi:hypothetical protein
MQWASGSCEQKSLNACVWTVEPPILPKPMECGAGTAVGTTDLQIVRELGHELRSRAHAALHDAWLLSFEGVIECIPRLTAFSITP